MTFLFKDASVCRVTCIYGQIGSHWSSGKHDGVDIVSDGDKTILAVSGGTVIRSGLNASWGEYIVVQMADGRAIVYAHMVSGSRKVAVGKTVSSGQAIGTMGSTGNSTGAHLHIELQKKYYQSGGTDDITAFLGIANQVGKVVMSDVAEIIKVGVKLPGGNILKASGIMQDGNNYVSIRQVLEALGYTVGWDGTNVLVSK